MAATFEAHPVASHKPLKPGRALAAMKKQFAFSTGTRADESKPFPMHPANNTQLSLHCSTPFTVDVVCGLPLGTIPFCTE
jgi:hypothetical protein